MSTGISSSLVPRSLAWIEKRLADIAKIALIGMALLITLNVLLRYLWDAPLAGVTEIASLYFMVTLSWISIADTQRLRRHISVDFLITRLSNRSGGTIQGLVFLACGLAAFLMAWQGLRAGLDAWGQTTTGAVNIPTSPPRLIFAFGLAMLAVRFLLDALTIARDLVQGRVVHLQSPDENSTDDEAGGAR